MKPDPSPLRVLIVAGEPSGDLHAAALMKALRKHHVHPIDFRGIGGDRMLEEGLERMCPIDRTAVMGYWEVLRHLRFFGRLMQRMTSEIDSWHPDLLLTVDYPGFNLRLAERAHRRGVHTVHYICPQVWAWHRGRIPHIARILDQLIAIFPFEPECFAGTKLHPVFAGHPLVDRAEETLSAAPASLPWSQGHRVALLPGSRIHEIAKLLPDMLAAGVLLEREIGPCAFMIPAVNRARRELIERLLREHPWRPARVAIVDGQAREVLRQARAAAVASGTATLEAALMRCPTVLVYRTSWITYGIGRLVIRGVKHIGLANIVADREVMPELLQREVTPKNLARHLAGMLRAGKPRENALAGLESVRRALGPGDAAGRAARAILDGFTNRDRRDA